MSSISYHCKRWSISNAIKFFDILPLLEWTLARWTRRDGWLKVTAQNDVGFMFNTQDNIAMQVVRPCPFFCGYSCLLGKSEITGSSPTLAFKFQEIEKMFLPCSLVKIKYIVESLCYREVACSASDHQSSNFESCV